MRSPVQIVILLFILVLAAASPAVAQRQCPTARIPYVSSSVDGGQSFVPYRGRPPQTSFLAFGLAPTGGSGRVFMHAADTFWVSEDDGCRWSSFGPTTSGLYRLAAAPGGVAYAWPVNGGSLLYRLGPAVKGTDPFGAFPSIGPASSLQGFGVDASDASHVRTIGRLGQIYESFDNGTSWSAIGVQASPGGTVVPYFGFFDPQDLDHVIYGQVLEGGFVTFDGGQTWTKSSGLSSGRNNFFNGVISPVDGNIVFGMGLDMEEDAAGAPSGGRHIYASTDGGLTYAPVLDHGSDGVILQNGPTMVADAGNADLLHFVFSVRPVFGGTIFYRYDRATGSLQLTPNTSIQHVRSLAFSQAEPAKMLAGFEFVP